MRVAVFGLGYVGCVSATCLADLGHDVVGVDVSSAKVEQINAGITPIIEPGLADALSRAVSEKRLRATTDPIEAVTGVEVVLICVGTPSSETGSLDLRQLLHVAEQLSSILKAAAPFPIVAIRSTVMADTALNHVLPKLTSHGLKAGVDFGLCLNPEFLREGTAVRDFHEPPATVIGELDPESGSRLARLYQAVDAPIFRVDLKTASLVKYASNAFHALKVTFANEIGVLCERIGADSHAVMDVFCRDTKLNISKAYLRPGFAFGGSCLPKDLRAILHRARHADADLPVLNSILRSNELHVGRAIDAVIRTGLRRVGIMGLSFKNNTDDLRESPLVTVVEQLLGRGFEVRVYDAEVAMSRIFGRNREFIERTIPHITSLIVDSMEQLVSGSELLVIGKRFDDLDGVLQRQAVSGQVILDLARVWGGSVNQVAGRSVITIC